MTTHTGTNQQLRTWVAPRVLERTSLSDAMAAKPLHLIEVFLNGIQVGPQS